MKELLTNEWIKSHATIKAEWHDLRKNQNDLPDNSRYVWTNVGAGYHDDDDWWDDFGRLQNVIAWCEPKFKEKKMTKIQSIESVIENRMEQRLKNIYSAIAICLSYEHEGYFVAGNSCNTAVPHDFDIYPWKSKFNFADIKSRIESVGGHVIIETRNALTVNINDKVIQFCNYRKPNLVSLIESFDFAHIQIGVAVEIEWRPGDFEGDRGGYECSYIKQVEYTDNWMRAHLLETTWYTGSEYPLSSLLRTTKYFQRGAYAQKYEYKKDILNILRDIISRGYSDYQDYKDQLAAVDLLLLEPEEKEAAWNLFLACGGRGLVKTFTANELEEDSELN